MPKTSQALILVCLLLGLLLHSEAVLGAQGPVITEIMQNPSAVSDYAGEYIELYNPTANAIDLYGYALSDEGVDYHVISEHVLIGSGGYTVLCRDSDPSQNGGVPCDYEYRNFRLSNEYDEVILSHDQAIVDEVRYDNGLTFPDPVGASMNLDPGAFDPVLNDLGSNWCESKSLIAPGGDRGTPGKPNDTCKPAQIPEFQVIALPSLTALAGYLMLRRLRKEGSQ